MALTRSLAPIAVVGVLLGLSGTASATTVVLIRTPHPSAIASEATVRLRGELRAEGFDVEVVDSPAGEDARAFMEEQAAQPGVSAVVAILAAEPTDLIELWVIDRVTGKTVTRRLSGEPAMTRSAEVLSIRALELLRASFLEIEIDASKVVDEPGATARPAPAPPPPEVTRMTQVALDRSWPRTWAIEAGGCLFGGFGGLDPTVAPMVRGERMWRDWIVGRVTFAGLGTRARVVQSDTTSASVSQTFGLVEVGLKLRARELLRPFFSIGAGVLYVATEARTQFPAVANNGSLWTPIADAGAGLRLGLRRRFEVSAEVHAQLAARYPAIQFFGETAASGGRPTLMGSLTLVAWL